MAKSPKILSNRKKLLSSSTIKCYPNHPIDHFVQDTIISDPLLTAVTPSTLSKPLKFSRWPPATSRCKKGLLTNNKIDKTVMQWISKHTLFFLICNAAVEVDKKNGFKIKTHSISKVEKTPIIYSIVLFNFCKH